MQNCSNLSRHIVIFLLAMALIISPAIYWGSSVTAAQEPQESPKLACPDGNCKLFLPVVVRSEYPFVLAGMYSAEFFNDDGITKTLVAADQFAGKKHSVAALFWSMEDNPSYNLKVQLDTIWRYGYTPFINLSTNCSPSGSVMQQYANGSKDWAIRQTAQAYKDTLGTAGDRKAFIALFPEMNGKWTCYYDEPSVYKSAYDRIRQIFVEEGVALNQVWWVFPPNGYTDSTSGQPLEGYYPGDDKVDILAFSSYNFGYCPVINPDWRAWVQPPAVFDHYIDHLRALSSTKPIIIAQTGTSGYGPSGGLEHNLKNQWLVDAYNLLASREGVLGVLYFEFARSGECDYAVYYKALGSYTGYAQGLANPAYKYILPADLVKKNLVVTP